MSLEFCPEFWGFQGPLSSRAWECTQECSRSYSGTHDDFCPEIDWDYEIFLFLPVPCCYFLLFFKKRLQCNNYLVSHKEGWSGKETKKGDVRCAAVGPCRNFQGLLSAAGYASWVVISGLEIYIAQRKQSQEWSWTVNWLDDKQT